MTALKSAKSKKTFSARYLKWLLCRTLCRVLPALRSLMHFYDEGQFVEDLGLDPFYQDQSKTALSDTNQALTKEEKDFIAECWDTEREITPQEITRRETLTLLPKASIYGHTGSIIYNRKVILENAARTTLINHNLCKPAFSLKTKKAGPKTLYLSMVGLAVGHKHFYHFFIDLFPAVFAILKALPDQEALNKHGYERFRILLREDLTLFQEQAYEFVTTHYPHIQIEFLKSDEVMKDADTLYYDLQQNVHSTYLSRDYISFLKHIYAPHLSAEYEQNKSLKGRYYISRGDTKNRNIRNEEEVIARLAPLGFEAILPAQLPLDKQIEIFASAEVIIAATGAAFTNLIYANPRTKVGIFYPLGFVGSHYLWLAKSVGIQKASHQIAGEANNHRNHSDIPIKALEEMLETLEIEAK